MRDPKASRRKYLAQIEHEKMIARYKSECGECTTRKITQEELSFLQKQREIKSKYKHKLYI